MTSLKTEGMLEDFFIKDLIQHLSIIWNLTKIHCAKVPRCLVWDKITSNLQSDIFILDINAFILNSELEMTTNIQYIMSCIQYG